MRVVQIGFRKAVPEEVEAACEFMKAVPSSARFINEADGY
jgi:hypothetical protein